MKITICKYVYVCTTSGWKPCARALLEKRAERKNDTCNVFICPRVLERRGLRVVVEQRCSYARRRPTWSRREIVPVRETGGRPAGLVLSKPETLVVWRRRYCVLLFLPPPSSPWIYRPRPHGRTLCCCWGAMECDGRRPVWRYAAQTTTVNRCVLNPGILVPVAHNGLQQFATVMRFPLASGRRAGNRVWQPWCPNARASRNN